MSTAHGLPIPLDPDAAAAAAVKAQSGLSQAGTERISTALRAIAEAIRADRARLVSIADEETALGTARLDGEVTRTAFQLELFADLIRGDRGSAVSVDLPDADWPPAPRPDLRRRMVPVGVVAVFAASNFPFAFSVVGGDTASALAAGCPVIVKAHPGHPRLSRAVVELASHALVDAGLPVGAVTLVEGLEAGQQLVLDDRVDAVAFTGSTSGGRALFDLATSRSRPIPFYGELGSVNPVFVTEQAARQRGDRIWAELAASFTLGAGQFCTKPGIVFVPRTANAPAALASQVDGRASWRLLNESIALGFARRISELGSRADIETVVKSNLGSGTAGPSVFRADVIDFLADPNGLAEETFGPATTLIEYDDESQLVEAASLFVGELTGTLQAEDDDAVVPSLIAELETRVGRLIWNQWPTGVAVTGAMQHGGPYPASTSSRDTSVGSAAIDRFLRPVAYQNFPRSLLPEQLQHDDAQLRRN